MNLQQAFDNAMNCGDFNAASELAETMNKEELIPCDDELNRLKEFLADFKKPTLRYTGTDHLMVGPWPGNTACGHLKNYGADNTACTTDKNTTLREEIRACWSALRDLERKRIVY